MLFGLWEVDFQPFSLALFSLAVAVAINNNVSVIIPVNHSEIRSVFLSMR